MQQKIINNCLEAIKKEYQMSEKNNDVVFLCGYVDKNNSIFCFFQNFAIKDRLYLAKYLETTNEVLVMPLNRLGVSKIKL